MGKKINKSVSWWLDCMILNTHTNKFNFNKSNNIYYLTVAKSFLPILILINKKNLNSLLFSNLDAVIVNEVYKKTYHFTLQTIFFDHKILLTTSTTTYFYSISSIYFGNTWLERELKEMTTTNFLNLSDTRKLLLNYNYNVDLIYNNYNQITNEILV